MTKTQIYDRLVATAKHYDWEDVDLYLAEIGWDADWMQDYVEDPDSEMLSTEECRVINGILLDAFEGAHKRRFARREREYWLNR